MTNEQYRMKQRAQIAMNLAKELAELSTCDRANVGAVIYQPKTKKIVGMGYNGSLPGHPHCDDAGHLLIEGHCVRTIHAEDNALQQAKEDAQGGILFVTHYPCVHCTKDLIRAGIKAVVYYTAYRPAEEAADMMNAAEIIRVQYGEELFSDMTSFECLMRGHA